MENEQNNTQQNDPKGGRTDSPSGVFVGVVSKGAGRKAGAIWPRSLFFPILIVFIGVVYLLNQMDIVSAHHVFIYVWPLIFVFFGLEGVIFNAGPGRFLGWVMTITGVALLLCVFRVINLSWGIVWPVLIIYWGLWMLAQTMGFTRGCCGQGRTGTLKERMGAVRDRMGAVRERMGSLGTDAADSRSDISVIFSSLKRRISSQNFQGGRMAAVFGEADIDLSDANIAGDEIAIEAEAIFGAHKIRVPRGWDVQVRGTAVFGEFVDKTDHRAPEGSTAKRLIVFGHAVFGSVVIRD